MLVKPYYEPGMEGTEYRALMTYMNEQLFSTFGTDPEHKAVCLHDMLDRYGDDFPHNARTAAGGSPLHDAMQFGCLYFAELLVELGGNLEARTHAGKSLLMACIDGDKPESARWLLAQWRRRAGKPLEVLLEGRSAVGYTPLWWCGMDGRTEIAALLLAHGADHRAVDRNGQSCRSIGAQRRNWPVVGLLDEAERAYTVACARRLGELGRAAPAADPEAVAKGREEVVAAVAFFVCQTLPDDLWRVLDEMVWGSVGSE